MNASRITTALLAATFFGALGGCDTPETSRDTSFPWDGEAAGKADVFGRALIGVASPYDADAGLGEREEELQADARARRSAAWVTIGKVLEPVPLLGLAEDAEANPEIELGEIPDVPRFQTWYGVDDFKRVFQFLYEGLGPAGRRAREGFSASDIEEAFVWNAGALERSSSWPLQRYIDHVNRLDDCPEGLDEQQCDALFDSKSAGAAGGIARIAYSPATLEHVLGSYSKVVECLEELDELSLDAEPSLDDNFSQCFESEFPIDAVLVKAQWERADFGRQLPVWDTDGDALRARLSQSANWGEDGDRQLDPGPQDIYTIQLRNGATYRLAGLHIMTKELRHWQWTTLWWSDRPDEDFGADRPQQLRDSLPSVWSNYKMCSVTFFDENDEQIAQRFADLPSLADAMDATSGGPTWCSNPYIEHGRGNAGTNCIGCHQHGGATVAYDRNDDGVLDPLQQEDIIDDPNRFPEFGRSQIREVFPADYLYSFNHVDDLSHVLKGEIEFFDFQDGQAAAPRIDSILGLQDQADLQGGAELFERNCEGCHGPGGTGGFGPALFDRVPLRDDRDLLQTLLQGRGRMPAWGEDLDDRQLADLHAYLRATFDPPALHIDTVDSVAQGEVRRYQATVPAGTYSVRMTHDPERLGGDADLYVRVGEAPTLDAFDCRPYDWGSDELCTMELAEPATLHVMVRGYSWYDSAFALTLG